MIGKETAIFPLIFHLHCLPLWVNMEIIDSVLLLNHPDFCLKEISGKKEVISQFPEGRIYLYLQECNKKE
jgi:hypothetical protein